ncbi:MAG: pseudouridine synthase [Phycisphaerales bacterium JB039]
MHEDDDIIVVDKPAGMLSVGAGRPVSALGLVKQRIERAARRGRVWVVHRLDRETSGLLVFAKSERAFGWLKEDLRSRRMSRQYLALVEGLPAGTQQGRGVIRSLLVEGPDGRVRSAQPGETGAGPFGSAARPAVTHYRVLGQSGGHALLAVTLDTGRKHQIRAHLSEQGSPVAGDRRYGARTDPLGRMCLHAWRLEFAHPVGGRALRFESPAPAAMYRAVGLPAPDAAPSSPEPPAAPVGHGEGGWDHVAAWYDQLLEEGRRDHFQEVIGPGVLRLLDAGESMRILDVACGQGAMGRLLAGRRQEVVGVDASERLIEAARRRAGPRERYVVGDARRLEALDLGVFDSACCIMALMNIDPLGPVLGGIAAALRPGGAFVGVILHPAFRAPRQTSWGWDADATPARQYRRVDGYLSTGQWPIVMNPGAVARGAAPVTTMTHHRPIQRYIHALHQARLVVELLEEWPSMRRSEPGPRAEAENRARREIPLLLAWRARKVDLPPLPGAHERA